MPALNMPLWCINCFELFALKKKKEKKENSKCRESFSLNIPYLPKEKSSKETQVSSIPLHLRVIDQGGLTLTTED